MGKAASAVCSHDDQIAAALVGFGGDGRCGRSDGYLRGCTDVGSGALHDRLVETFPRFCNQLLAQAGQFDKEPVRVGRRKGRVFDHVQQVDRGAITGRQVEGVVECDIGRRAEVRGNQDSLDSRHGAVLHG